MVTSVDVYKEIRRLQLEGITSQRSAAARLGMHLPAALTMPFVRLGARMFGHFNLRETSGVEAVQHTNIPILLIHGEDDRFVPCDMSREIFEACTGYKLHKTFPGAGHGLSYIVDSDGYKQTVAQFAEYCLNDWCIL